MVNGAGDGHSRTVLSQHRHVRGAHVVQGLGDAVVLGVVGHVFDQAPDLVGKAFLQDVSGPL